MQINKVDKDLLVKADYSRADGIIRYSTDRGESWDVSVFVVADALHDARTAGLLVQQWLEAGNWCEEG